MPLQSGKRSWLSMSRRLSSQQAGCDTDDCIDKDSDAEGVLLGVCTEHSHTYHSLLTVRHQHLEPMHKKKAYQCLYAKHQVFKARPEPSLNLLDRMTLLRLPLEQYLGKGSDTDNGLIV